MQVPCDTPGCVHEWGHAGIHSTDERNGRRVRTVRPTEAASGSEPEDEPKDVEPASSEDEPPSSEDEPVRPDSKPRRRKFTSGSTRQKGFWPHESKGPSSSTRTSDVLVPKDVDLSPGKRPGSAEVKLMNLTSGERRWGGSCTVTKRELKAIGHKFSEDNTDVLLLGARDTLLGDVYVFLHWINVNHKYHFNCKTFRVDAASDQPDLIDGEPTPAFHRTAKNLQDWLEHLQTWTGGPPILIMHFHPEQEDLALDVHRPPTPAGVRVVRGVGCGDSAPAGGEIAHAFVRRRITRFAWPAINFDPIADFDGTDWNLRMVAFDRCFLNCGSNLAFGELGCAIAVDALKAAGACAVRHPNTHHYYDLLFAF